MDEISKNKEKNVHWVSMGYETQFSLKFGVKMIYLFFLNAVNQSLLLLCVGFEV
jgi:hypothetical protein